MGGDWNTGGELGVRLGPPIPPTLPRFLVRRSRTIAVRSISAAVSRWVLCSSAIPSTTRFPRVPDSRSRWQVPPVRQHPGPGGQPPDLRARHPGQQHGRHGDQFQRHADHQRQQSAPWVRRPSPSTVREAYALRLQQLRRPDDHQPRCAEVDGSLSSPITVNSGGILAGGGTLGAVTLCSGGHLSRVPWRFPAVPPVRASARSRSTA